MPGRKSRQILKAAIAALRPRGGPFDVDIEGEVLESACDFLRFLPSVTRYAFPLGLRLVEYGGPLFGGGWRRFTSMDVESAGRYLVGWESATGPRAMLYQGLRAVVLFIWYQHPQTLRALEVDWQGRADELVPLRARLLAEAAAAEGSVAAEAEPGGLSRSQPEE